MFIKAFSRSFQKYNKNKIEGTPILKLAMVKRLWVKKILPKNQNSSKKIHQKIRQKNSSKNLSKNLSKKFISICTIGTKVTQIHQKNRQKSSKNSNYPFLEKI